MSEKLTNSQIADAFLEAISSDNEAIFSDVCAHDMIIWHNVDREDKLFREYFFI